MDKQIEKIQAQIEEIYHSFDQENILEKQMELLYHLIIFHRLIGKIFFLRFGN